MRFQIMFLTWLISTLPFTLASKTIERGVYLGSDLSTGNKCLLVVPSGGTEEMDVSFQDDTGKYNFSVTYEEGEESGLYRNDDKKKKFSFEVTEDGEIKRIYLSRLNAGKAFIDGLDDAISEQGEGFAIMILPISMLVAGMDSHPWERSKCDYTFEKLDISPEEVDKNFRHEIFGDDQSVSNQPLDDFL